MQILKVPTQHAQACVLALGNFDGVHLGHQALLKKGLEVAVAKKVPLAVLRFYPHPDKVLFPERKIELLTTAAQQQILFSEMGVNLLYEIPFSRALASTQPEDFVKTTLRELKAEHVVVGFNYSFGAQGKGTPEMLRDYGEAYGFGISVLGAQIIDSDVVSSTRIRHALSEGNVKLASKMLGRLPTIVGRVVQGEQRGRTLGFPTANIEPDEDLIIPQKGVYAIRARVKDLEYDGMMNIGVKPTFHTSSNKSIEVHLFNFNANIYGLPLEVQIVERIRDEQKFANVKLLQEQLYKDAEIARSYSRSFTNLKFGV